MESTVQELNGSSFHKLLKKSKKLLVVEFYTVTCPNCRAMAPVLEKLGKELKDAIVIGRINAEIETTLAATYGIMGVPTFKFFCNGRPVGESVGAVPKNILRNTITDLLERRTDCIQKSSPLRFEITGYG